MSRWPLVLIVAFGCGGSKPAESPSSLPSGTGAEILDARSKHEASLAEFGRWEDDPRFVTRWCPRDPPPGEARFEAFRNYGHWEPKPRGTRWVASRPGTWLETTTRKGWWLYRQSSDEWCWVPGVLDAHIAWRTGLAYVGWAPVPPSGKLEEIPDRSWTYTVLGVLYDTWLTTLTGEARTDAMVATKPTTGQSAPSTHEVATAREDLVRRAKDAGMGSGNDLPPAQSLWALLVGKPAPKPSTEAAQGVPIGPPMKGIPGMEGMGALKGLLGADGGLPPGLMPMLPPTD